MSCKLQGRIIPHIYSNDIALRIHTHCMYHGMIASHCWHVHFPLTGCMHVHTWRSGGGGGAAIVGRGRGAAGRAGRGRLMTMTVKLKLVGKRHVELQYTVFDVWPQLRRASACNAADATTLATCLEPLPWMPHPVSRAGCHCRHCRVAW